MKKKKILTFIIIIILIAACTAGVLVWRGVISFGKNEGVQNNAQEAAAYLAGEEEYITINIKGTVVSRGTEEPSDIPKITGIEFSNAETGSKIDWGNTEDFEYVAEILEALKGTDISANEIIVDESGQVTLVCGSLKVQLGKNEKTSQKIKDLNDFISELNGKKGTLNMKEVNDTLGYSFRPEPETVTQAETTTAEEAQNQEENTEANENGEETPEENNDNGDESSDEGNEENNEETYDEGNDENTEESWDEGGENGENEQNIDG